MNGNQVEKLHMVTINGVTKFMWFVEKPKWTAEVLSKFNVTSGNCLRFGR